MIRVKTVSKFISELSDIAGMGIRRTTPYHAMANGMAERFNQSLLKKLETLEEAGKLD